MTETALEKSEGKYEHAEKGNSEIKRNPVKKEDILLIYTDGASRGNPGHSAIAFILGIKRDGKWYEVNREVHYIGETTNNVAEYTAIIRALENARKYTRWNVVVHSDSELVIKQIRGEYRIKADHLSKYCDKVYDKMKFFENVEFFHVPRENPYIEICDRLCNEKLDEVEGR